MNKIDFSNAKKGGKVEKKKRKYTMKREYDSIMLANYAGYIQLNNFEYAKKKLKEMKYFDISDPYYFDNIELYTARCTEGQVMVLKGSGTKKMTG